MKQERNEKGPINRVPKTSPYLVDNSLYITILHITIFSIKHKFVTY